MGSVLRGDAIESPRIRALRQDFLTEHEDALTRFWDGVKKEGAPLVEDIQRDDSHRLVTFLWRGDGDTTNVVVFGGPAILWDFDGSHMVNLPGTNVWRKTFRVRSDTRTTYRLSPNDPLTPPSRVTDWAERMSTLVVDPLNPRMTAVSEASSGPQSCRSLMELPDAPPQPWIEPHHDIAQGVTESHQLRSTLLGNTHDIWVYTPAGGASPLDPARLLVLLDGEVYKGPLIPTPTILDNLIAAGLLPPVLAVMVGYTDRNRELACDQRFSDFLAHELLPWARERYGVGRDPASVTIGGSSLGGLAAAHAAFRHPNSFGGVLSQSGAFWWGPGWTPSWRSGREPDPTWEWLTRQIAGAPTYRIRFWLEVGLLEREIVRAPYPGQIVANRHLSDVLTARGYDVRYSEFSGGHDYVCWRGSLADGLIHLLGK